MEKTVTIKDIAAIAGVSPATVHLALAGKPGPKVETRERILKLAKELDYRCNAAASSLKRGVTRIGAVLPRLEGDNRLYYEPIWTGVQAFFKEHKDFNLELVEFAYDSRVSISVPVNILEEVRQADKIAGLIVLGDIEMEARKELRQLRDQQMPIVLVNSDVPEVGRVCCVQTDNYLLGRAIGEILLRQTPASGGILACAGEATTPANYESIQGLQDYIAEHDSNRKLYKVYYGYSADERKKLYQRLLDDLRKNHDIVGCCSVTARGSVELAQALEKSGLAGTISAVGSDIFPQNIESLKKGIFQNLMFKNPYQQGWLAAERLFQYIFYGSMEEVSLVKSEVVFQSTIAFYE